MVDLVLDDLGSPAVVGFQAFLEGRGFVFHLDLLIAGGLSGAAKKGQAPFLCFVGTSTFDDAGVKHNRVIFIIHKCDDALVHTDHI